MMSSPVSLTVHRNTKRRRQRKELRKEMMDEARRKSCFENLAGFVIIVWDDESATASAWNCGDAFPGILLPAFARATLTRDIGIMDAEDIVSNAIFGSEE